MSYYMIFSTSEQVKIKFFEMGLSWAQNITKSFQTITISQSSTRISSTKAPHNSTQTNWMNSRGSPGNSFTYNMFVTSFLEFLIYISNTLNCLKFKWQSVKSF